MRIPLHEMPVAMDYRLPDPIDGGIRVDTTIASLRAYSWFGFFGPGGTPKPMIERFYRDVVAAVREEKNYNTLINKFRVEVPLPTPDELRTTIVEGLPFWAKIIRDNNIKAGT